MEQTEYKGLDQNICEYAYLQTINNGKADFMGRRLLEDTNRRLRAFREKGGGRYPENEMLERAVQEAGLRHLGDPFRGGRNRAEMPTLR